MPSTAVSLAVDGIAIAGEFYFPHADVPHPAICICHGIPSGNPPDPTDGGYPALADSLCREGFAVFIFNFRGCRNSGGNFDIPGWSRDLNAAIDYLHTLPEVDSSRLALLGFSAGAAVSAFVAAHDKRVSCLALCACPAEFKFLSDSPQALIDHFRRIGIIRGTDFPASVDEWLDGFQLVKPIDHIAEIAPRPLLVVHGTKDEVVDISHARRLYRKAGKPKELSIIEGAGHRLRQDEQAMKIVMGWLKRSLR
ncbi:MAG: alpha/beta fold hydrolase [Dehalococcoidales bacterium]|nr:alpha/beta fold hydrolase [Dehalococcoidales bacterium]